MKTTIIAGVSIKANNPPTREQLIKAAKFKNKLNEADIIKEIDSHELYRSVPKGTDTENEQGSDSGESKRTDTAKRRQHNKPGKK